MQKIEPERKKGGGGGGGITPDLDRRKEPLEQYPLDTLAMVGLLELAQTAGEADVAHRLAEIAAAGALPDLDVLRAEFAPRIPLQPSVQVHLPPLAAYDQLVGVRP